jgi:tetratricopeptide (TPR) repeat protein
VNDPLAPAANPSLDAALQASRLGDSPRALALFQAAIAAAPTNALPRYLFGAELAQAGRMLEAEGSMAQALILDPAFDMARFQLGLLQFTERRVAVALLTWAPLFDLPTSAPLQRFVSGFAALARDDFDQARTCLREGITANSVNAPLNADVQRLLAQIDATQPAAPNADATSDEATQDDTHILLANYHQQGRAN